MTRNTRRYTSQFRTDAVERAMEDGVATTAQSMEVPLPTLNSWVTKAKRETSETDSDVTTKAERKSTSKSDNKYLAMLEEEREVSKSLDAQLQRAMEHVNALRNTLRFYLGE